MPRIKRWAIGVTAVVMGFAAFSASQRERGRQDLSPFLGLPERLELVAGSWALTPAFANLTFDAPVALVQAPRSNVLFVSEREGRIHAFDNDAGVLVKRRVLDLSSVTQGQLDSGLLGLAFHPDFGTARSRNRSHAYVHYAYSAEPTRERRPPDGKATRSRLARFTVDLKTWVFDPQSELVLIDQDDQSIFHQGGAMFFHPKDGFLYLTVGDEGSRSCLLDNCQRIDKDLFSGVLRIDVDEQGGAVSHPIPRQPETGRTSHYFIPNDNPFVGVPSALEEFYAIGLRSPHRMTYDAADDIAWIADVGQHAREELDVLRRSGNYQWNSHEGFAKRGPPAPEAPLGIWTDPVLDLKRTEAGSIIGGHVYRGGLLPSLVGKYIYGDFMTGNIWALSYKYDGQQAQVLKNELLLASKFRDRKNGITSFGIDAAGEVYVLTLGKKSKIQRVISSAPATNAPRLLSQVGFLDARGGEPRPGLLEYDVQNPLWSDGTTKQRWMSLPSGTIGFHPTLAWRFPEGTVFVKHFAMALDESQPGATTNLETRFLVAARDGEYYGVTYKWNADGSDAEIVLQRTEEELEIRSVDGQLRKQTYVYPGPHDCMACHNDEAGSVLGVRTEQLNDPKSGSSAWYQHNPLLAWSELRVFDRLVSAPEAASYPSLVPLDDESRSPEDRLRSYWSSNCSMCHRGVSGIRAGWDARISTPLSAQGIVNGMLENGELLDGERVVVPGDLDRSAILSRSTSTDASLRMPPLVRRRVDATYTGLLKSWIRTLPASPAGAR